MVYTGIRFYKYYGSLTLKNITGIRFYKYLWVSDPKKHSLFIGAEHRDIFSYVNHQIIKGAEHRNICNNANQPDVKKVQSTEISIIILSTILRCAAPHSLHAYSVLQMLRVSDPKSHSFYYLLQILTGIRFYKYYGSLTLYHSSFIPHH